MKDGITVSVKYQIPAKELSTQFVRSSGPGGQNVNKSNTKAVLIWHFQDSESFPEQIIKRFKDRYSNLITQDGKIVISSSTSRSQIENLERCKKKLADLLRSVLTPPKKRIKTKPSRSSKEKRILNKKRHAMKKSNRRFSE